MGERTVRDWLSRIDKDTKEARNRRIFDRWLACWTQEEIAEAEGVSQPEVARSIPNGSLADLDKTALAAALETGPPPDLDIEDLAREEGVTPRTVHRWIREGEAPRGRKVKNQWRWTWAEVHKWRRERGTPEDTPRGRGRPKTWERGQ